MAKPGFVYLIIALIVFLSGSIYGDIPAEERVALIALYNSTDGDNWTNNSGWKTPPLDTDGFSMAGTEGTWYGITVSDNHVTEILLSNNNKNGSIPKEIGNFSCLKYLYLNNSQLVGNIPMELGNLSNLTILDIDDNQLSGSIPSGLGNLGNLTIMDLAGNQLSGSIPSELGNLGNLTSLELSSNQLSGSIPPWLGNLSNLTRLELASNRLSGSIPPELGNLTALLGLKLNSNRLTGSIPSNLVNLNNLIPDYTDIGYNGLCTNDNTLRTFLDSKDTDWENTQTTAPSNISAAAISTSSIGVSWTPITYTVDTGSYRVYYSTTSSGPYTYSGMTSDKFETSYNVTGLSAGTSYYFVVKAQTNPHTNNDNTVVSEYSEEVSATTGLLEEKDPPFGSFDTPIDGSTVFSSIPVTGWALDDTGIENVKIYREQGNSLIYIGEAILVEGARPDVATKYLQYPNNTRAGWGYMMLTNFLPGGGNGTFVIHAIATDTVEKTTTLGTKTIYVDNANAVKPFGAIDTPTQGGTASGSSFINWGWVLTPQPNSIPCDGSTIKVWVDGVNLGNPRYCIYRGDIATLFPEYANSNGAAGYFYLDTTAYENGVHTIQWTATDDAGNTDGIGSRYFTIQNAGSASNQLSLVNGHWSLGNEKLNSIPVNDFEPVILKKGFNENKRPQEIYPDDEGFIDIEIKELEPVEVQLEGTMGLAPLSTYTGFLVIDDCFKALPIGSTLDTERGLFSWQPGPGFYGTYEFVFLKMDGSGRRKIRVKVKILPKHSGPLE